MQIKYRTWGNAPPPRPTKLEIPGWAGTHRKHNDGCTPQPWHCVPFVEGATYGLEVIYPFEHEVQVTNKNDNCVFTGKFFEKNYDDSELPAPFSNFAPGHYGFTSSMDLKIPEDHVIRLEPHPRFFTDTTGTCPIAVPGHIQSWWCRIFFMVFKMPAPHETHVFSQGQPIAQILIIPKKINYEIEEMSPEEKLERVFVDNRIVDFSKVLTKHAWKDYLGNQFDDKYKQLQAIYNKSGMNGIVSTLKSLYDKRTAKNKIKVTGKYVKKIKCNEKL